MQAHSIFVICHWIRLYGRFQLLSRDQPVCSSIFIMISGCLYLDSKRTWNLRRLWKRNILPIAAAYIFWQMFYAVYRIITNGTLAKGSKAALVKFMVYISKSYFHLWYLPMLIGLLIITPMLWEIVNSARGKQWEEYMIVLFLVFQILPYTINYFPLPWKDHIMDILQTVQPGNGYRLHRIFYTGALSVSL